MAKKKVFVGLSGGVDSSVVAALLLEQGYDVVPVFMKCWEDGALGAECPWEEDQKMALAVAEKLGIAEKFQSWNFEQEYFQNVVEYLVDEAKQGRTGNPDVVCNRTIKFGAFLERALKEGADFVATGHYARIRCLQDEALPKSSSRRIQRLAEGGLPHREFQLLRPKCEAKNDQTYFLWQLNQAQLSRTLFPIGDFKSKEAVREEARRRGLPTADRKSTRGICFVGKVGQVEFLSKFIPQIPGEVVTTSGKVVGTHQGVNFYTLGQRQGIGVAGGGGPYYVVEKNETRNELVVAPPAETPVLWKKEATLRQVHWISGVPPELPLRCSAFIRHPQPAPVGCTVNDQLCLIFDDAQWAPTPGQSVVLYDDETVLGGGVIQ